MTAYLDKKYRLIFFFFLLVSCYKLEKPVDIPGMPLIHIDFDERIENKGVLPVICRGVENVSYTTGVLDYALDLSEKAKFRKPIVIVKQSEQSFNDYPGFTVLFWVNSENEDFNAYTIIAQLEEEEGLEPFGWSIERTPSGSWKWKASDGVNNASYEATVKRQPINDGTWHMIGFSLDFSNGEARLYYDGINVAVYSLADFDQDFFGNKISVGVHPFIINPLKEIFNGKIDDLKIWSRVLNKDQVEAVYNNDPSYRLIKIEKFPDSLTIMTWNIWNGGQFTGKYVGPQRIAEIIEKSGADLIAMQETFDSGEKIADRLGYYYYKRSEGLSVLSRYPIGKTYNIYRPRHSGAVDILLPKDETLIFCPIALSYMPGISSYILSGNAEADSVVFREMQTRGNEIRYILWELQTLLDNSDKIPVVLAGDFNSGSHLDWTEANSKNRYGLVIDFPVSRHMEQSGFYDAYRQFYPDEVKFPGFTWSPRFKEVLQDRTNYIYYKSEKIKPVYARVIDEHYLDFPSDHAALVISFSRKD